MHRRQRPAYARDVSSPGCQVPSLPPERRRLGAGAQLHARKRRRCGAAARSRGRAAGTLPNIALREVRPSVCCHDSLACLSLRGAPRNDLVGWSTLGTPNEHASSGSTLAAMTEDAYSTGWSSPAVLAGSQEWKTYYGPPPRPCPRSPPERTSFSPGSERAAQDARRTSSSCGGCRPDRDRLQVRGSPRSACSASCNGTTTGR
jgi:hypothetical protein